MANMLGRSLALSLPRILRGERGDLLIPVASRSPLVLLLHINFSVQGHDIRGYIALLMDMPSLLTLRDHIAVFIGEVTQSG